MMRPTQTLPENYREFGTLDITRDRKLLIFLNVAGIILVGISGWLFFRAMLLLMPEDAVRKISFFSIQNIFDLVSLVFWLLVLTAVHVILHEAVHGFFFWVFTKSRPLFAFRGTYAYAAAPEWFIPRNPFLITTLAPLVLISLIGLALVPILPPAALMPIWYILTMNAGGSVGDLFVAGWIMRQSQYGLIQDRGDSATLYIPENSSEKSQN